MSEEPGVELLFEKSDFGLGENVSALMIISRKRISETLEAHAWEEDDIS